MAFCTDTSAADNFCHVFGKISGGLRLPFWNPQVRDIPATGNPRILAIANPTREDCDFMVHLVDFLEHYADKHFKVEEQCMESFRCPSHAKNKQAHKQFMIFIPDFKEQYQAKGFQRDLVARLHETLGLWLMEHILQVDTQLKPCIKG